MNFSAYLHAQNAFNGKPQRYGHVVSDFRGGISELLAKAVNTDRLDMPVTDEDKEILLAALQSHGALDNEYKYVKGPQSSSRRGYAKAPGGGLDGRPVPSDPINFKELVNAKVWANMDVHFLDEFHNTMFQPVGGMGKFRLRRSECVSPLY